MVSQLMDKEGLIAPLRGAAVMGYGLRVLISASWPKWVMGHGCKNNFLSLLFFLFFLFSFFRLVFWSHAWSLATTSTLRMSTSPAHPTSEK